MFKSNKQSLPPLVVILGPTAAGKTSFGIKVAQKINGAIVSADSRQLYTGLNIGTAKPPAIWANPTHPLTQPDLINHIPHYLFNVRDINKQLTLADWQKAALTVINKIIKQNKIPVLVGGTMLYLDSIIKNYSLPQVPPNPSLRHQLASLSTSALYQQVIKQDPAAAKFIEPQNQQRSIRALEVMAKTGKSFSSQRTKRPPRYNIAIYGLFPDEQTLLKRIAARVEQMWIDGLLEETSTHHQRFGVDTPLLKTMNYAQAATVLTGTLALSEAQSAMVRANMRYACRQMSWWRARQDITWLAHPDVSLIVNNLAQQT